MTALVYIVLNELPAGCKGKSRKNKIYQAMHPAWGCKRTSPGRHRSATNVPAYPLYVILTILLDSLAALEKSNQGLEAKLAGGDGAPPASGGACHAAKPSSTSRGSSTSFAEC
jgi:hypothetical protein